MGKIKQYEIQLDDPQLVYAPGQTINGKVVLQLGEDLSVKGIRIKCRGKAYVAWKEGKNNYHFNGENYIHEDKPLYGTDHGSVTLRAGNHSFPFQFALPYDLPSSFERPKGSVDCHVRYWLKTFMDGTMDEYKMAITVATPLDLNTIPNIMNPAEMSSSKDVCCLCCRRGPITARLRVPRVGFVPGDTVDVEAEVDDNTGRGTNSADIKLVMKTKSFSNDGSSQYPFSSTMVKVSRGPLSPGGTDSWVGQLQIPPTPVSGLPGCGIIELEHQIVLSVNVRKTPMDLDVSIPVVIGTIPYNDGAHGRPTMGYSDVSGGIRSEEIVARV